MPCYATGDFCGSSGLELCHRGGGPEHAMPALPMPLRMGVPCNHCRSTSALAAAQQAIQIAITAKRAALPAPSVTRQMLSRLMKACPRSSKVYVPPRESAP